jgi:hypothetical protein
LDDYGSVLILATYISKGNMIGKLGQVDSVDSDILCISINPDERDSVANLEPVLCFRSNLDNLTRSLVARNERSGSCATTINRRRAGMTTLALNYIKVIDTRVDDLDEDLVGSEGGARNVY